MMTEKHRTGSPDTAETELYEEPPRMTAKDAAGVILALVALTVIGIAGYIWLTPDKGFADLMPQPREAAAPAQTIMAEAPPLSAADDPAEPIEEAAHDHAMHSEAAAAPADDSTEVAAAEPPEEAQPAATPDVHDHAMNCSYCGMFADKSGSHAVAEWSDGSHTHHDCWDCLFNYGTEEGLTLSAAEVVSYGSPLAEPDWLDAGSAWFLYDTKAIKGSMPPFVAAFADRAAAEAAQASLGGEVVDFAGLRARWE